MVKHFLQFKDLTRDELEYLFERTRVIKDRFKRYEKYHPLEDRTLVARRRRDALRAWGGRYWSCSTLVACSGRWITASSHA